MERIALIGIGNVTQRYIDAFTGLGVDVIAYHRTDLKKAKDADGVCILTEPQSHYDLMQHFRHVPVLIEKPLACDYKTARLMQRQHPNLYPGFQLRYNKQLQLEKEKYKNSMFGGAVINAPRGQHYYLREWRKNLSPMAHIGIHAVDFFIWWFGPVKKSFVENGSLVMLHNTGAKSFVSVTQNQPNSVDLKVYDTCNTFNLNSFVNHYDMCYDFLHQKGIAFDASESIYQIEVNNLW